MRYRAPWAASVKVVTILVGVLLLVVGVLIQLPESPGGGWPGAVRILPLALLIGAALFTVRGYRLEAGFLRIERLVWTTSIDLSGLRAARHDPEAMKRSLRLFGNGGLFVIAGLFYNRKLGRFRAFATDPKSSVVLEIGDRKVVVTPDAPEDFIRNLRTLNPGLAE